MYNVYIENKSVCLNEDWVYGLIKPIAFVVLNYTCIMILFQVNLVSIFKFDNLSLQSIIFNDNHFNGKIKIAQP